MPKYFPEDDLITFLNRLDQEGEAAVEERVKKIDESMDIFKGKGWKSERSPYFLYNVVESAIEDKIGKLSESKPVIRVLPSSEGLQGAADVLQKSARSVWDRQHMEYRTERLGYLGATMGAAFAVCAWEPESQEIEIFDKDGRSVIFDPYVQRPEALSTGEYVRLEDWVPLSILHEKYPVRGSLVKADARVSGFQVSNINSAVSMIRSAFLRLRQGKEAPSKSPIARAVRREYFVQDRRKTIDDVGDLQIVEGVTKWAETGKPFPGGRRIIRCGDIILSDTPNPYWDAEFPLDMLSWKVDLESAWGPDEIQSVKRLQEAINRIGDAYTRNLLINTVVRVVMEAGALSPDERNKISNQVGQFLEVMPGRKIEFTTPPPLPPDSVNFVDRLIEYVRQKVGATTPPTQKRVPSIITGPAIEGLQLMIETPIRTAARRLEDFYERLGKKIISRIFQYYESKRLLHLVGDTGKWTKFEFEREKILVDEKGDPRSSEDLRKAFKDFSFVIEPGSSLAITRVQRALMKYQLAQQGWVHPREVLLELNMENPDEILKEARKAVEEGLIKLDQRASANAGGGLDQATGSGIEG